MLPMRSLPSLIALAGLFLLVGCQHASVQQSKPTWQRFFPNNDDLIGVRVQQSPDNGNYGSYAGKHPAMVDYVFRRGSEYRMCQVEFSPMGDVDQVSWLVGQPDKWLLEQLRPMPRS
jgi:hypothetical protein